MSIIVGGESKYVNRPDIAISTKRPKPAVRETATGWLHIDRLARLEVKARGRSTFNQRLGQNNQEA